MFAPDKTHPETSVNGQYDYDLIVIGGGSGGLAASKEAAKANPKLKIAVFDYVTPTPNGTTWGLGGTCVNVGCIPKKLFHFAAQTAHSVDDYKAIGHEGMEVKHNWDTMVENVDNYLLGMQYGYQNALSAEGIKYIHAYASFVDNNHTVAYTEEGKDTPVKVTAAKFILAVGGRPRYPDIPNAELGLTSDDIFWWKKAIGKTLVIGGSYIALECAGFLHGLGRDTSVMVRSILLRGFDQQCAQQIGELMERDGVRFLGASPQRLDKLEDGKIQVTWKVNETGQKVTEVFGTVLFATGRVPQVAKLGLDVADIKQDGGGFIVVNDVEQTSQEHIYAIGDVVVSNDGTPRPELTPVAIQVGQLLARRLYKGATRKMDYLHVPTTVFTPNEYGCVGLSEEQAQDTIGKENVITFLTRYGTLETAVAYKDSVPTQRSFQFTGKKVYARQFALENGREWQDYDPEDYEFEEYTRKCLKQPNLAKLVCDKKNNNKVLGLHYIGPQAGEVLQGFALAIKAGVCKEDFDELVGIHPTTAEEFTLLTTVKESGEDFMKKGGC